MKINNLNAPPILSDSLLKTLEEIEKVTAYNYPKEIVTHIGETEKVVLSLLKEQEAKQ